MAAMFQRKIKIKYFFACKRMLYWSKVSEILKKCKIVYNFRFFPWLLNILTGLKSPEYQALKAKLFSSISEIESHLPELREKNALKILEIGVGTGKYQ